MIVCLTKNLCLVLYRVLSKKAYAWIQWDLILGSVCGVGRQISSLNMNIWGSSNIFSREWLDLGRVVNVRPNRGTYKNWSKKSAVIRNSNTLCENNERELWAAAIYGKIWKITTKLSFFFNLFTFCVLTLVIFMWQLEINTKKKNFAKDP